MVTKARKNKYKVALKAVKDGSVVVNGDRAGILKTIERALRKALYVPPKR